MKFTNILEESAIEYWFARDLQKTLGSITIGIMPKCYIYAIGDVVGQPMLAHEANQDMKLKLLQK